MWCPAVEPSATLPWSRILNQASMASQAESAAAWAVVALGA